MKKLTVGRRHSKNH